MSTTPSGIRLDSPLSFEVGRVQAARSKFERLAEQERFEAAKYALPPENRPKSSASSPATREFDRSRSLTPQPRSRSRASYKVGPVSLARATSSNPWRPPPPPDEWEDWMPDRAGPKDLEVGTRLPSIRSKTPIAQMLDSKLVELPDFVVASRPQSAISRRHTPSNLRKVSMDATSTYEFSEVIARGTDPPTAEVMRRLEQHQAQHVKPRLSRSPSAASIIPSLPPLPSLGFGSQSLFSTSPPNSRPGSPVSGLILPNSRRKSSTDGSGSSTQISIVSSKISEVTTPDCEDSPPSSVDAVIDEYTRKRDVSTPIMARSRNRRTHNHSRGQRHSVDLSGAPDIPPIPRTVSINMGGDAQADLRQRSLPYRRPPSSNSYNYSPEAMRSLHGGVMPVIDLSEVRPAIRKRPPVTGRNSFQHNRITNQQRSPSTVPNLDIEQQHSVTMSRRASYSSVTGISPTPIGPIEYRPPDQGSGSSTLPRAAGRRVLSLNTVSRPPHRSENFASPSAAPTSPTGTMGSTPNPSVYLPSPPLRKKVGDFNYVNTLESADRPYTPDEFVVNMTASAREANRIKGSSKRSVRSLASFMSRHSENDTNLTTPLTPNSVSVLRKENPSLKPRESGESEYFDAQDTVNSIASKKAFDKMNADVYMTDIPISPETQNSPTNDDGEIQSISSDVDGERRLKSRPSLFRLLDCTVAPLAVSGLSEEIARVSDQIQAGKEPESGQSDSPPKHVHMEKDLYEKSSPPPVAESSASTSAMSSSTGQSSQKYKKLSLGKVFRESRVFIRESFNNGLGSAVQSLRSRRNTGGSAASQERVSVYMAGALPSAKSSKVRLGKGKKKAKDTIGRSSSQSTQEEANLSEQSTTNSSGISTPAEPVPPSKSSTKSVSDVINATAVNINHDKSVFTEDLKKGELKGVKPLKSVNSRMNSQRGRSMTWGRRTSHDQALHANKNS